MTVVRGLVVPEEVRSGPTALARLRRRTTGLLPLDPLRAEEYGAGHTLFEARSDQRAMLADWLLEAISSRWLPGAPLRVLSVGSGDGVLDACVLAAMAGDRPLDDVRWHCVEPLASSARACRKRLAALGVDAEVHEQTFGTVTATCTYDVVSFVHSLYYVPDVPAALRKAAGLLAPDGRVLVLHAPQAGLNELGALLAPPMGHQQWWSETTRAAIPLSGLAGRPGRLTATLNLADCADPDDPVGRAVLDFTVQAHLPDVLHAPVLNVLRAQAGPGRGLRVPHPLDTWVLRCPRQPGAAQ